MFFSALATVVVCWINCCSNNYQAEKHPFVTVFSGGSNLSKTAYTFFPPWTGFEVAVLLIGVIGFILLRAGESSKK